MYENDTAYVCVFCLDDGRKELAVAAEITTDGTHLNLCGRHLDATCEVRSRLGIGFSQPLPMPGHGGGAVYRQLREPREVPGHTH